MTELIVGHDNDVGHWVASRIPHLQTVENLGEYIAIGIVSDEDEIMAGAVFNNYRGTNIEIQFASVDARWATKENIGSLLSYPFVQLGVSRLTAVVSKNNKRVRKFLLGIGFKNEGTLRNAFLLPDGSPENAIIYGMIRKEAGKWLEGVSHGKVSTCGT